MKHSLRISPITVLATVIVVGLVAGGCGKRRAPDQDESGSVPPATPHAAAEPGSPVPGSLLPSSPPPAGALAETIALWQKGQRDEAVEAFVKLDFSAGVLFDAPSPLALTERDFQLLKAQDREAALTTAMSQTADISVLCTEVIHKGQTSGNRAYIDAVSKLADRILSDKDSLSLLLNTAMGLKENVEEVSQ